VNNKEGYVTTTSSRSLAVVGVADTINDAEMNCEKALENIQGDHIYIRHDIGTSDLINKRINHMNQIRGIKI
jgi:phosphoribosylamine--glycine ligase